MLKKAACYSCCGRSTDSCIHFVLVWTSFCERFEKERKMTAVSDRLEFRGWLIVRWRWTIPRCLFERVRAVKRLHRSIHSSHGRCKTAVGKLLPISPWHWFSIENRNWNLSQGIWPVYESLNHREANQKTTDRFQGEFSSVPFLIWFDLIWFFFWNLDYRFRIH